MCPFPMVEKAPGVESAELRLGAPQISELANYIFQHSATMNVQNRQRYFQNS
jgi:hypothetical protein